MGLTNSRVCKPRNSSNPMFGANRLALNRDKDSVLVLTPNIGLIFYLRGGASGSMPRSILAGSTPHRKLGGADRDRTGGLLVANQALSQLSYSPNPSDQWSVVGKIILTTRHRSPATDFLVGLDRLELSTSPLSGVRSSHLSYRPD